VAIAVFHGFLQALILSDMVKTLTNKSISLQEVSEFTNVFLIAVAILPIEA